MRASGRAASEVATPPAPPTKRTLVFPAVPVARRPAAEPEVPSSRPSERPTAPTLPPLPPSSSDTGVIELSASVLVSERDAVPSDPVPSEVPSDVRPRAATADHSDPAVLREATRLPPWVLKAVVARRAASRGALLALAAGALAVVAGGAPAPAARAARAPDADRQSLALVRGEPEPKVPTGGCTPVGPPRVLASRARLGPGLDVSVLDGAFGVGFAAAEREALGVRVERSSLRVAERVRVRASAEVRGVAVDAPAEDADEPVELRVDADGAAFVAPDQGPPFRVAASGGWIVARRLDASATPRTLWALPWAAPPRPARGFARLGARKVPPPPAEPVHVAARDDGGAVVALRRSSSLWVGAIEPSLAPAGPLAAIPRAGAAVGKPSVAPWGGGGAVAWAERAAGEREWSVAVAGFAPDGEGVGPVRVVGPGMSPSLAPMPDGDLLLVYSVGAAGSHRVVAQRLGRDLAARGEPLFVSPDKVNAGQPRAAVAADGRGLVAFFTAERGRAPHVLAAGLACDSGL